MTLIKTDNEIKILQDGGQKLSQILQTVIKEVKLGVTTAELADLAEKLVIAQGGRPSFKGYGNPAYPAALCVSINDEIVHGIPSPKRYLKNGDIVSLDIGMQYPADNGLYTDMSVTVPVGNISRKAQQLIDVTKKALLIIEENIKPGVDLSEIAAKVQNWVERNGFSVVRDLVGHGVGHQVHEEPQIPNYVIPNFSFKLEPGMVLAFEPMVTVGSHEIETKDDKWTAKTADGSLSAHFEHTFVVTKNGCEVLTR